MAIRFEFWMKGAIVTVEICPLWLMIFKSIWHSIGDCSELYFVRCCVLKRTGTSTTESKVTCLFQLILRSDDLTFHSLHLCQQWFWDRGKLFNSRQSKTNFMFGSVSLDCQQNARVFFPEPLSKKETAFSYFFSSSCFSHMYNASKILFGPYLLPVT